MPTIHLSTNNGDLLKNDNERDVDASVSSKSANDSFNGDWNRNDDGSDLKRLPQTLASNQKGKESAAESTAKSIKRLKSDSAQKIIEPSATNDSEVGEFDLCTPEGQIAASKAGGNPRMTWMEAKRAARREYNRLNASRARQRHKDMSETRDQKISELQAQVEQLTVVNQLLMTQFAAILTTSLGTSPSPFTEAAASSSWIMAMSAIAEASSVLGISTPAPPTVQQKKSQPEQSIGTNALTRLPQQQQQQLRPPVTSNLPPANFLSYLKEDYSKQPEHPVQQYHDLRNQQLLPPNSQRETFNVLTSQHMMSEAPNINTSWLWKVINALPPSQQQNKGFWDLLLSSPKFQALTMTTEDIKDLRQMK
jgi:hypothetical protein